MTATSGAASRGRAPRRGTAALLVLPTVVWYVAFLIALVVLLVMSFGERSPNGGYQPAFTLEQFQNLTSRITPLTNTLGLAALNTLLTVLVAFPVAYVRWPQGAQHLEARLVAHRRAVLDRLPDPHLCLDDPPRRERRAAAPRLDRRRGRPGASTRRSRCPWASSTTCRSWSCPSTSAWSGWTDPSWKPRGTREPARGDARQIVLPLAAPGILSGIVLVFIPVMGEYSIPVLLGGGKTYFLGNALADLFLQSRNWPFGSALASTFVLGMVVLVAGYLAISRRLVRSGRETSLL